MKFRNKYSFTEKLLHNLAFKSWPALVSIASMENNVFSKELALFKVNGPVFITALPRAGTTLLLELFVKTNEFASHTYSDMPFLPIPLFWERYSKLFKGSAAPSQERAHGDGMMINVESPEAFEEILWKGFWTTQYKKDRILPWGEPTNKEFESFLKGHLKKIIYLRGKKQTTTLRYISKNNLHICRIKYLKKIFPDSVILVPFRDPWQHASSLLRQHLNFVNLHAEDQFSSKYMADIGHYDFGKNLRPVDFNGWLSDSHLADPDTITFWLQYWINAYQYILENNCENVTFLSYEQLCQAPQTYLEQLSNLVEIKDRKSLTRLADTITAPKQYPKNIGNVPQDILDHADKLYLTLQKKLGNQED